MLHKIPIFTHILCTVAVLLCCLGGARPTAALTDAALTDSAEDGTTVYGGVEEWSLSLTTSDTAERTSVLTLTLAGELPPDADPTVPAAVLVTVNAPEGWRVIGVEASEDAPESLTVTVSAMGSKAVILADGDLESLVGLTFSIVVEGECGSDGGRITATCSEGVAFYDPTRDGVDYIPVSEAYAVVGGDGGAGQGTSPATDGESEEPDLPEPAEGMSLAARLIGCQETPCADGVFSVRFIYQIAGGGAIPTDAGVVCLAGRGVISVEVSLADSVTEWVDGVPAATAADEGTSYLLVTLRGLSAEGTWVFRAECGNGKRALVRWQDGQFWGWQDG